MGYAQRRFIDASPAADIKAEQQRIDSLIYTASYEYELADTNAPNGRRYLVGRYEYGMDGVIALRVEYGFDTDSTAWYYGYTSKAKVVEVSMISRRAIIQTRYHYNKRTGRLDSSVVSMGQMYKHIPKYSKDGTIAEFDVRRIDITLDTSAKKKRYIRSFIPHERIVFSYDTNSRPLTDTIYTVDNQMKSASSFRYDDLGRMTVRAYHEPGVAAWIEEYSYDDIGNLGKRIHTNLLTNERKHFVMFYK